VHTQAEGARRVGHDVRPHSAARAAALPALRAVHCFVLGALKSQPASSTGRGTMGAVWLRQGQPTPLSSLPALVRPRSFPCPPCRGLPP
jgi:hypothetical protein